MNKFKYTISFLFLLTGVAIIAACKKDKTVQEELNADCSEIISYESDIRQTIQQSCGTTGCHNAGANTAGYTFETHEQVGNHATIILKVIRHEPGVVAMPTGGKLSDEYIEKFFCWVEQGKLNN